MTALSLSPAQERFLLEADLGSLLGNLLLICFKRKPPFGGGAQKRTHPPSDTTHLSARLVYMWAALFLTGFGCGWQIFAID